MTILELEWLFQTYMSRHFCRAVENMRNNLQPLFVSAEQRLDNLNKHTNLIIDVTLIFYHMFPCVLWLLWRT